MRTCVIFNPAAKGQKAERLRSRLDIISQHAQIKQTAAAGDARRLAAEAIAEGCDTIVAAGGDGTINEVLNGIGDANAFERVRLGVLPLGTINVFALELGIPFHTGKAWDLILRGCYTRIDLGWAEFSASGAVTTPSPRQSGERVGERGSEFETKNLLSPALSSLRGGEGETPPVRLQRRYFMQLGGAGLDARAIELVDWQQKKRVGPLAYVVAGLRALRERQPKITVRSSAFRRSDDSDEPGRLKAELQATGELVLIGNGKFYGGRMEILKGADLRDGLLDICVFPRVKTFAAVGSALSAALFGRLPANGVQRLRAAEFTITAEPGAGFELDGEFIGQVPVKFGVERERLRVIVP